MQKFEQMPQYYSLENHGITNTGNVYWNLSTPNLYEEIVRRREGLIAHLGPIVVKTGDQTGRSANDKFIVKELSSEDKIWWGKVNKPFDSQKFENLYERLLAYLQGKDIFIQDCFAGADKKYQIPIRIITEDAWHNLFARNMFIQAREPSQLQNHIPKFTVINVPRFHARKEIDGTNSEVFIIVNFGKRLILIGGTSYAGEIKKSVFTILNYLLPQEKILSMHCSANVGENGDVAIFFGLSGTGKTTLSADPKRKLIGDDEHGWSDDGVFNFEGGCYAKVIKLSKESEPEIYRCTRMFGTILENVAIDSVTRKIDLNDAALTENTRAAYPITHIDNSIFPGLTGHPKNIILLTCDAFGVMPPIAKLNHQQTIYHFLSGYTAKIAGTEKGMGKEPSATFSPCFGAPFMALPPTVYAKLLGEKISQHNVNCWLVNTGWIGGSYGVGKRIKIEHSRAMINAALNGKLTNVKTEKDSIFGLNIPVAVEGVPTEILNPRNQWKNLDDYDNKAKELVERFKNNFKEFEAQVDKEVVEAGF